MRPTLVALAVLIAIAGRPAQAMEIVQFDKMADADQDEYLAELFVRTQKVLRDAGQPELAEKVRKLFTELQNPGDQISLGMAQFEMNLARGRKADLQRIEKDQKARRLEVEDVMIVTLRKNNIELPPTFLSAMKDFKPRFPMAKK